MKEEGAAELGVVAVHWRRQGVAAACQLSMAAAGHGPAAAAVAVAGWLHWHGGSDRLQKISGPVYLGWTGRKLGSEMGAKECGTL